MNMDEVVLIVLWPAVGPIRTNDNINKYIKSRGEWKSATRRQAPGEGIMKRRLHDYLQIRKDAHFIIEDEWLDPPEQSEKRYHTVSVSTQQLKPFVIVFVNFINFIINFINFV